MQIVGQIVEEVGCFQSFLMCVKLMFRNADLSGEALYFFFLVQVFTSPSLILVKEVTAGLSTLSSTKLYKN